MLIRVSVCTSRDVDAFIGEKLGKELINVCEFIFISLYLCLCNASKERKINYC